MSIRNKWKCLFFLNFPTCGGKLTSNTKYIELIKRRSKVQEKNMSFERAFNFDQCLFTNLPRIVKFTDFSPSSFKLKRGILPLLTKYVS